MEILRIVSSHFVSQTALITCKFMTFMTELRRMRKSCFGCDLFVEKFNEFVSRLTLIIKIGADTNCAEFSEQKFEIMSG